MSTSISSVDRVRAALAAAGHPDTIEAFPDGTRSAADAAAEEDAGERPAADARGLMRQFPSQRVAEAGLVDPVAHMGIEVAIGTLGGAERPVDV